MIYLFLANLVFALHLAFVLFAIFGGLLALRLPWVTWLHIPAVIWAVSVEFFQLFCPLTTLENYFKSLSGEQGYSGGFIEYYVAAILYTNITPQIQIALGAVLLIFNLIVYRFIYKKSRRLN